MLTKDVALNGVCRFVSEVIMADMADSCGMGTSIDIGGKQNVVLPSGTWQNFICKESSKRENFGFRNDGNTRKCLTG